MSGVICDRRIAARVRGQVMRPAMMYSLVTDKKIGGRAEGGSDQDGQV